MPEGSARFRACRLCGEERDHRAGRSVCVRCATEITRGIRPRPDFMPAKRDRSTHEPRDRMSPEMARIAYRAGIWRVETGAGLGDTREWIRRRFGVEVTRSWIDHNVPSRDDA